MTSISPQQKKYSGKNPFSIYKEMATGKASCCFTLYYEFVTLLLSNLPGLLGLSLRSLFYSFLFKECGKRPAFGKSMLIRGSKKINIGNKALMDDLAVLDARGDDASIKLGDLVSLGRSSALVAKDAQINIEDGVNIGSNCRIASQSQIAIGQSTLIGAYSYIGPGNHQKASEEEAMIERPMENKGGVIIGKNVWIGARVTILDGVSIGDNAIIGAHSLVNKDIPPASTAVGIPARVKQK